MTQYNWGNLSDHDFEMVCRDVMAVLLGVQHVEAFASGVDGGIDLRYQSGGTLVIGQAKHFLRSSYSKLLSDAGKEKTKMDNRADQPTRYIFFTSQELSPHRKGQIAQSLAPYCHSPSDVLGADDIEGVIQANSEIEKHHYKLWLSSVKVLSDILGNATRTHSDFRIQELTKRARLFVPHNNLREAETILQKERSLIVSGPPGIGKTTLAEMLSLRFLAAGYMVHFVSKVSDLEREVRANDKQLFVYDDFLGRTNLYDAPPQSDQERLFTFMRGIRGRPHKYLIMTTREYLYREAVAANERLIHNRAEVLKCLLDVSGYTPENRARILYNHLYWASGMAAVDLRAFVFSKGYRRVIAHPEFNPRFIADTISRLAPRPPMNAPEDEALWT